MLITGPAGIGKTRLARHFAESVGRRPFWIIGAPAMRGTQLGAVAAAIPVGFGDDVDSVWTTLRERLPARAFVIVEAAEHLDTASAAIVARLFASFSGVGIVTAGGPLPPALRQALDAAGVREVVVPPLDLETVTELVEDRIGGELSVAAAVRLQQVTGGNPFFLTEYVEGALRSESLAPGSAGIWELEVDTEISDDLRQVAAERLAGASESEERILDLLSLCAPLPRAVVDHLGLADGVGDAPGDLVLPLADAVVCGQAMFTQIRRGELGPLQRRRLVGDLVEALAATGERPVETLHRARLCLEYGLAAPAQVFTEGAATAFLLGDLILTEQLARRAIDTGAGLGAHLQLSRSLAGRGQAGRALQVLAEIEPDSLDEDDLAGYAITVAITHTVGQGDHAAAHGVLDKFEPRITSAAARAGFAAIRALASVNAGRPYPALQWARAAQALGRQVPLWSALGEFVEAESLRRSGEVARPLQIVRQALGADESGGALVGTGARRTLVQALLSAADLPAAQREGERLLEVSVLQHIPQAIACATLAQVHSARGDFSAARRLCETALAALGDGDRTGLGRGTAMHLTIAHAMTGDRAGARAARRRTERATASVASWAGANLQVARAFEQISVGEITRPVAVLRAVADESLAADQRAEAAAVLHAAVRLGDRIAAQRLLAVALATEGTLPHLQRTHAAALLADDAAGLSTVADDFGRLGFLPAAADTWAQAVALDRTYAARLAAVLKRCTDYVSPVTRIAKGHSALSPWETLSPREAETFALWDAGCTGGEIAEILGLTTSTVTGLLARLRTKMSSPQHGSR
ncbi:LuxR C-terminal-related transcriptional regulator [Gordonia hirsuta]|uniref:LuxR C-terminal-related transcriptional regulator n=1 Tax=Gordonia hirsuta TaxID=53427 RepID=UPI0012DF9739|nr:LuxR C-terminal-related transcriptional regulator [Gordonia hirsuta]